MAGKIFCILKDQVHLLNMLRKTLQLSNIKQDSKCDIFEHFLTHQTSVIHENMSYCLKNLELKQTKKETIGKNMKNIIRLPGDLSSHRCPRPQKWN